MGTGSLFIHGASDHIGVDCVILFGTRFLHASANYRFDYGGSLCLYPERSGGQSMMNTELPLWGWVVVALLLFTQSIWLFVDARKHGHPAWMWGILGLIHFPVPSLIYLLAVRKKVYKGKSRNSPK